MFILLESAPAAESPDVRLTEKTEEDIIIVEYSEEQVPEQAKEMLMWSNPEEDSHKIPAACSHFHTPNFLI